jgi:hypothetical protein
MPTEPAMKYTSVSTAKPGRSWLQNALIGGGLAFLGTVVVWVIVWKIIR